VFLVGVSIVTVLYLLASAVFMALLPRADATNAGAGEACVTAPQLGELLMGSAGGRILAAVVLVSALGSLAAFLLSAPRLYVAMAQDGLFPRRLARLHPRLGTPLAAIAVCATLASLLVVVGSFGQIVAFFVFATVVFLTLSVAAILVLPAPPPGAFRAPARRFAAWVFVVLAALLLLLLLVGEPVSSGLGAVVVALGLPVYGWLQRRRRSARA
jgi:APA family basic amino acid/polyamine antiporter